MNQKKRLFPDLPPSATVTMAWKGRRTEILAGSQKTMGKTMPNFSEGKTVGAKIGKTRGENEVYYWRNLSGWWLSPTPLKNMKLSCDDEIPNGEKMKHVPNHQPEPSRVYYWLKLRLPIKIN